MIQIYAPGNRNYSRNGDAVLHPSQCDVEMNLKGDWQLTLESPADENINLITKRSCDQVRHTYWKRSEIPHI